MEARWVDSLTRLKTHRVVKGFLDLRACSFFPQLFQHLGRGGRRREGGRERGGEEREGGRGERREGGEERERERKGGREKEGREDETSLIPYMVKKGTQEFMMSIFGGCIRPALQSSQSIRLQCSTHGC